MEPRLFPFVSAATPRAALSSAVRRPRLRLPTAAPATQTSSLHTPSSASASPAPASSSSLDYWSFSAAVATPHNSGAEIHSREARVDARVPRLDGDQTRLVGRLRAHDDARLRPLATARPRVLISHANPQLRTRDARRLPTTPLNTRAISSTQRSASAAATASLADAPHLEHLLSARSEAAAPHNAESPLRRYEALVNSGVLRPDEHQTRIIDKIQRLHDEVIRYQPPPLPSLAQPSLLTRLFSRHDASASSVPPPAIDSRAMPQGLYLYGDVGTGKTMLMDLFYSTLPAGVRRRRRVHFHAFMADVHKRLHAAKARMGHAGGDSIVPVARELAEEAYVLCFDEFQVTDIADAMILRRLIESLLNYGVVCVMTSNRHPDDLYKNGIQRASFVPCIDLIKERFDVTDLDSGTDYRRVERASAHVYHSPLNESTRRGMRDLFNSLASPAPVVADRTLSTWGRNLRVPLSAESADRAVAMFPFADLCGSARPLSAADYLEICRQFDTLVVTDVPKMDLGTKDMARRFITFVDACYESKTRLYVSSEVPIFQIFSDNKEGRGAGAMSDHMRSVMDDLGLSEQDVGTSSMFTGDEEVFAFARCCSRLVEMGSQEWAENAGRGAGLFHR